MASHLSLGWISKCRQQVLILGVCKPCLAHTFSVGENITKSMLYKMLNFRNRSHSLLDVFVSIIFTTVHFFSKKKKKVKNRMGSNCQTQALLPSAKIKYANIKIRGLCFFSLLHNWLNCHCWRLHGVLFPLWPYSIGQTEKYIATDETHHLGTLCFQLSVEILSKIFQLSSFKKY